MATALGKHPQLIAWQIDNGLGGHQTEFSFNEQTRRDWHAWLEAKYETIERLNEQARPAPLGPGRHRMGAGAHAASRADAAQSRRSCWTGCGSAATPSWPSSRCRRTCCTNSRPTAPSPPISARFTAASTISTSPRRWISCRWTATPPSKPVPPNWPANWTCCAR